MTTLNPVQPGALITSATWNQMIIELMSLEGRVAALESGPGGPVITSTSPSGQITVPSLLTIVGNNFVVPVNSQNTVSIDGVTIDTFVTGSNQTMLILDLPTFSGLPKTVQMTVTNRDGTSAPYPLQLALAPPPPPTGTTDVAKVPQNLGLIQPNTLFTFQFAFDATLDGSPDVFVFDPLFQNASGGTATTADWQNASKLVDASGNPLLQGQVAVPLGHSTTTVGVAVTVPPNAGSVQLSLAATSNGNSNLNKTSNSITITAGQPYADNPNAPTFQVKPPGSQGPTVPIRVQSVNNAQVLQISFGQQNVPVTIAATIMEAGHYTFSSAIANAGGAWSPANPAVTPAAFDAAGATVENLTLTISSLAAAVTAAQQTLTVTATKYLADNTTVDFTTSWATALGVFDMTKPNG